MFLQNANLKAGHTIRITFDGGAQRDHVQGPLCLVWIFFFLPLAAENFPRVESNSAKGC